ncbi:MAG: SCO family protein [Gammaproteobacteria bacterium]|nr:SCO family protein [Gammaproteobacteria bacterium]
MSFRYPAGLLLLWSFSLCAVEGKELGAVEVAPPIAEAPPGGDFTLRSADGPISLKDFRGNVVFIYFGYTRCPDICPASLGYLSQALDELSEQELKKVRALLVSVDPDRDTPESLKEYVAYFHPSFIAVTGTAEEVAAAAELYGAKYYPVELEGSSFGYAVNHSTVTYLVTPDGELRFIFPHGTPPDVLAEAASYVLSGS